MSTVIVHCNSKDFEVPEQEVYEYNGRNFELCSAFDAFVDLVLEGEWNDEGGVVVVGVSRELRSELLEVVMDPDGARAVICASMFENWFWVDDEEKTESFDAWESFFS